MGSNKQRDVLRKARLFIESSPLKMIENNSGCIDRDKICAEIDDALSAPARNCDVGTADEQAKRLHRFCISQDCATCPCNIGKADGRCEFAWMQMPYKEGGKI